MSFVNEIAVQTVGGPNFTDVSFMIYGASRIRTVHATREFTVSLSLSSSSFFCFSHLMWYWHEFELQVGATPNENWHLPFIDLHTFVDADNNIWGVGPLYPLILKEYNHNYWCLLRNAIYARNRTASYGYPFINNLNLSEFSWLFYTFQFEIGVITTKQLPDNPRFRLFLEQPVGFEGTFFTTRLVAFDPNNVIAYPLFFSSLLNHLLIVYEILLWFLPTQCFWYQPIVLRCEESSFKYLCLWCSSWSFQHCCMVLKPCHRWWCDVPPCSTRCLQCWLQVWLNGYNMSPFFNNYFILIGLCCSMPEMLIPMPLSTQLISWWLILIPTLLESSRPISILLFLSMSPAMVTYVSFYCYSLSLSLFLTIRFPLTDMAVLWVLLFTKTYCWLVSVPLVYLPFPFFFLFSSFPLLSSHSLNPLDIHWMDWCPPLVQSYPKIWPHRASLVRL